MPETIYPESLVRLTVASELALEIKHLADELLDVLDQVCTRGIRALSGDEFSDVLNNALTAEARRRMGGVDA